MLTTAGILLGLRLAYLRRQTDFHESEAVRIARTTKSLDGDFEVWRVQDWQEYAHHLRLANEYRAAIGHPWTSVDARMTATELDLDSLDPLEPTDIIVPRRAP